MPLLKLIFAYIDYAWILFLALACNGNMCFHTDRKKIIIIFRQNLFYKFMAIKLCHIFFE